MSKIFSRIVGFFGNRTQVGIDKAGNRYFTRKEEIDGIMKEKRWVIFKGEQDPTSIPVEWICWLNGQRKRAPTLEEMAELEARRELVKQNIARLKEEEQRRLKEGGVRKGITTGKVGGPDLQSFIRQFPGSSEEGGKAKEASEEEEKRSSEPTGSGPTFRPGTWQPPT
ncbi:hypothetical protein CRG98_011918 [Punica granatum]|uniref:NADH dehydrogenase [ubiquinone] 1 alpha subcomplex subunit 12 n=1 Tax=Punica granatum TaxID=22663 RepID=A0A2I0KGR7_PUNGR|nr:hypothetical protein CRG98_011918 [Punica granatum]